MGFDAETVWNHPANADLRSLRSDPNILYPGDILQVPDEAQRVRLPVRVGGAFVVH